MSVKIAIASGKGGTGKTFVSTNLFNALSKNASPVTLVDCDAEEPNVHEFLHGSPIGNFEVTQEVPVFDKERCVYCGKCAEYCYYNAIVCIADMKFIKVMEGLCHGCGVCFYACDEVMAYEAIIPRNAVLGEISSFRISKSAMFIESRIKVGVHSSVPIVKAAIKEAEKSKGILIFDSPPGTSCPFIQTVNLADYVVLVTEPTPFGLNDLKQSVETLRTMNKHYGVIVNKSGLGNDDVYDYLQEEQIPLLMTIPYNRQIAEIYSNGELLTEEQPVWLEKFENLFESIQENYGNSDH